MAGFLFLYAASTVAGPVPGAPKLWHREQMRGVRLVLPLLLCALGLCASIFPLPLCSCVGGEIRDCLIIIYTLIFSDSYQ